MFKRFLKALKIATRAYKLAMAGVLDEESLAGVKKPLGGGGPGNERW